MSVTCDYAVFDVCAYLSEYYANVGPENRALLRFLVSAFRDVPPESLMLDFGGGPTVYCAIAAGDKVREIHFADYAEANLEQVQSWLAQDPMAFDWHAFTREILALEGSDVSFASVVAREELVRRRVTRLMRCDALAPCPIGQIDRQYDVLTTNFCAEAAANDRVQWRQCMHNVASLLRPGGKLMLSAVKGANSYAVGNTTFFAVNIWEDDLVRMLAETGFVQEGIVMESVPADRPDRHYQGLMFVSAVKSPAAMPWQGAEEWTSQMPLTART
jgi:hypothetical protein